MVRFLHTADWQLGEPFRSHPERDGLFRTRFETIERLAEVAEDRSVDFVAVAGDVFDSNTVDRNEVVIQACERLKAFDVPVYLLPGNHDHLGAPNAVLTGRTFEKHAPEHVVVLTDREPVAVADGGAALLPAPLLHRHEPGETTEHFDEDLGAEIAPIRIGLAHGSVEAFDTNLAGQATNLVDPSRVETADLDYLALGDWHGMKRIRDRVWYSGTPEPDHYRDNAPGHALVVEISEHGIAPTVDPVETARLAWRELEWTFDSSADREGFERRLEQFEDPLRTVLRLRYQGSLPISELNRFEVDVLQPLEGRFFELRADGDLVPQTDLEDFEVSDLEGFVADAARHLLAASSTERETAAAEDWNVDDLIDQIDAWEGSNRPDTAETAARALHLLHRLTHHRGEP